MQDGKKEKEPIPFTTTEKKDPASVSISISIRRLAEQVYRSGGLAGSEYASIEGTEGLLAQKRGLAYLEKLPEFSSYQALEEYTVPQIDLHTEKGSLSLRGRADILFSQDDSFIICECKSFRGPKMKLSSEGKEVHWGQALLYTAALAYQQVRKQSRYHTYLLYVSVEDEEYLLLKKEHSYQDLENFLQDTARTYLDRVCNLVLWQKRRDASIIAATFPYPLLRSGQAEMMREVLACHRDRRLLFAEAPTGIGKTLSVLYPALKSLAKGYVQRIFYATAMTATRRQIEEALQTLRENSLCLIRSIRLSPKEKICPEKDLYCEQSLCPYAINYYDRLPAAMEELLNYEEINEGILCKLAEKHHLCPFELSLDIALYCDVIIGDYNHVFDPRIRLKRFFDEENTERTSILVDEAHNLATRSRSMYSANFNSQSLRFLLSLWEKEEYTPLTRAYPRLYSALIELMLSFEEIDSLFSFENLREASIRGEFKPDENPFAYHTELEDWVMVDNFLALKKKPDKLLKKTKNLISEMRVLFDEQRQFEGRQDLLLIYFELLHFDKIASEYFDEKYLCAARKLAETTHVSLLCLDASEFITDIYYDKHPIVFFSATLYPMAYYTRLLYSKSQNDPPETVILPSPFDKERQLFIIDTTSSIRYEDRAESLSQVRESIYTACSKKTGNYLVFVPSYTYLRQLARNIHHSLKPENTDFMLQKPNMTPKQKEAFISRFAQYGKRSLIAIAVLGGMFSEGIDLKGEQLSGVVCVGLGLPALSPERQLLAEYSEKAFGNGFLFAYVFPGFLKIQQASGRLIRSEEDKGFILLIDKRWKQEPYRKLLTENREVLFLESKEDLMTSLEIFWSEPD